MKGKVKKNISEFAVGLYTSSWIMISASELLSEKGFAENQTREQEVVNESHIYVITKMPLFSFVENSLNYEKGILSVQVRYKVKGVEKRFLYEGKFPLLDGATDIKLKDYPYRELSIYNEDTGEEIGYFPASQIGFGFGREKEVSEITNLEVLYVGQAFGDGSRNTFDRLKNHSTLQKILSDVSYNYPDDEVYLMSFIYEPYQILTMMDGRTKAENPPENDGKRFYSIIDNPLSEHAQICLAEAGLIRYFQPKFNKIYKENFPSREYKILKECYELDFSGLIVEINTDELDMSLFSKHVNPNEHHIAQVDLIKDEDRYSFFYCTLGDEIKTISEEKNIIK